VTGNRVLRRPHIWPRTGRGRVIITTGPTVGTQHFLCAIIRSSYITCWTGLKWSKIFMCTPWDFAWALFIISYKWYYCAYCNTAYATEVINHLYVFVIKMAHIQHTHVKLIPAYILCCAIVSYRMSFNYQIRLWTLIWAFLRYENLNLVLWFVTLRISVGGHQGFRRINCLQLLGRSWRQLLTTHKSVLYCVTTYNPKSIYIVSYLKTLWQRIVGSLWFYI
jgi:hypothetical protein